MFSAAAFIFVVAGLAAVTYGIALVSAPAAFIFGGIAAMRFAGRLATEAQRVRAEASDEADAATRATTESQ